MILTGLARIGRDVELRYVPSGEAVANISLAFNYGKKGDDGNKPTQWIEASLWGKRAEVLAQYLLKGQQVDVVLGDPHIETYQGKNGEGHKLAAKVIEIELAGGRGEQSAPRSASTPAQNHASSSSRPTQSNSGSFDDLDSDLPF